jgi:hypothetical protein
MYFIEYKLPDANGTCWFKVNIVDSDLVSTVLICKDLIQKNPEYVFQIKERNKWKP